MGHIRYPAGVKPRGQQIDALTKKANGGGLKLRSRSNGFNPVVLAANFRTYEIPIPTFEYEFHHARKWRFDLAWVDLRLAVEVQGGLFLAASRPTLRAKLRTVLYEVSRISTEALATKLAAVAFDAMQNGRHSQGKALEAEHEKLNAAAADGWVVLFTTPQHVTSHAFMVTLREAVESARDRKEYADAFMKQR